MEKQMVEKTTTLMELAATEFRRANWIHSLYRNQGNSSRKIAGTIGQDMVSLFLSNPRLALKRLEIKLKGIFHSIDSKRRGFELHKKYKGKSIPEYVLDLSRNKASFVKNVDFLKQNIAQWLSDEEKVEFGFHYYKKRKKVKENGN